MFRLRNTMMAICTISVASFGISTAATAGIVCEDKLGSSQISQAKINIGDAIQNSLEAHPGTIVSAELEYEDGHLVYAIEYFENSKEVEILVDATTGKVSSGIAEDNDDGNDNCENG